MHNPEATEVEPKKFDWRAHVRHGVENISPEVVEKFDLLEGLINENTEFSKDFLTAFAAGQYKNPLLSLITYSRGVLSPDEIKELHDAVMEADPELKRIYHR